MMHLVDRCYCEQPFYWRDTEDIKKEISQVRSTLRSANKRLEELEEARDGMRTLISELDLEGRGDESEEGKKITSELSCLLEEAERTYSECERLFENLDALKEELDESFWFANGGAI